jgi:hypothetical protein
MSRQASGQHGRLVKLSLHEPLVMQGYREDHVEGGGGKVGVEVRDRELEEWLLEVQFAAVFKKVNGLPQGAFVAPDGTGVIEGGWDGTT